MANNVDIAINAKNAASKVLDDVGRSAGALGGRVSALSLTFKGLAASMGPLIAVFAAIKGAMAFGQLISDSNEAFLVQEKAARGSTEAQRDYASQMQRVLGVGDEVSLQLMKQAELLGISKDQTAEAAKAAIGLSKATGVGTTEALKKVQQAMNGNANAFGEVIPGIQKMATEQEKLGAINDLITRGLEEQKASMSGLEGIQTRANNSWGDMLEVIGQILQPIRAIISQGFAVFAEVMQSALVPAVDMANAAMERLPEILQWVSGAVVGAVTIVEVIITNLPSIFEAAVAQIELYWLQMSESIKHVLTSVLPSYLEWFGDNWLTMLTDIFRAGVVIVQNYVQNYVDILLRLWEYVSSGFKGGAIELFTDVADIATRNLLEGFEAKTKPLPEIIGRKLTERERGLQERIGQIGAKLGTEFAEKFDDRMQAVNETFEGFSTKAALARNEAALFKTGGAGALSAVESRLGTRGAADDPNRKIVQLNEQMVKELQEANRLAAAEANKPPQPQLQVEVAG